MAYYDMNELKMHVLDILKPLFPEDAFVFCEIENHREIVVTSMGMGNSMLKINRPVIIRITPEAVSAYIEFMLSSSADKEKMLIDHIRNRINFFSQIDEQHCAMDESKFEIKINKEVFSTLMSYSLSL